MRDGPRKPTCSGCPHDLHYSDPIPQRAMGVMMHLGERFCTGGKKTRRFKRGDPKIYVPDWCPSSEEIPLCSVPAWRRGLRPLHSFLLSPPDPLRLAPAGTPCETPCDLRVYTFKNANAWWLHTMLERDLGRLTPDGVRYAIVRESATELSPREFWKRLESEPYQDILDIPLEPHSVLEIDDGLKPAFFYYVDGGFTLLYAFNAEAARKNKKED